ncbi:hypothetical protein BRC82_02070 [Halobacteriales archaeon QS_1_67_19]|nr:MAG: hypothetical protein BRC82_02070 [Halobacteriales archaeon QS_1_67_19]
MLPTGDHLRADRSERTDAASRRSDAGPTRADRLLEGAKGGLIATLVMTAFRMPIARSPPPTAVFWSKFVAGGEPGDHTLPALALHLCYGIGAGALFGPLAPIRGASDAAAEARREETGLLWGLAYAVALSLFGERAVLGLLLGMDLDSDERLVFHVGHLIYGLTLGTWLGSRASDR